MVSTHAKPQNFVSSYFLIPRPVSKDTELNSLSIDIHLVTAHDRAQLKISKKFFDLDLDKKTLVIIGGSLGSECINNLIKSELEYIKSFGLQTDKNFCQDLQTIMLSCYSLSLHKIFLNCS